MEGLRSSSKYPVQSEAFVKLRQGVEQEVQVPFRYMLRNVMADLKSEAIPVFSCTKKSESCFQGSVKIDVSTTTVATEPNVSFKEIRGEVSFSAELAIISAIKQTFKYLDSTHLVLIKDHSNKVAEQYSGSELLCRVNSMSSVVEEGIEQWHYVLDTVGKFEMHLVVEHMDALSIGFPALGIEVCSDMSNSLNSLLVQYCKRYRVIRSEFEQYLAKRNSYIEERNRNANDITMKGYGQVARITEKNILAYVLTFFGLGAASYENEYIAGSGYTSRVRFKVPDVENAVCDRMISIPGIPCPSVHQAEEEASYYALAFLEDELKVKVVDLNYDIQIKAKEGHKMIVNLLASFQALGEKLRKAWKHFHICMQDIHDLYSSDYNIINEDGFSNNQSNILDECTTTLKYMHDKSVMEYDIFCRKLRALNMYYPMDM